MERSPESDKYAKAKIEGPNLRLPKALLKVNTDPSTGELYYFKIFEDDAKKYKHIAEEVAAGAKPDRKVYRMRRQELIDAIKYEEMQEIHRISKATIGLIVDSESLYYDHLFLDLMGTEEQVKTAVELILDKVIESYKGLSFPIILMPPTVYEHRIRLHVSKFACLIAKGFRNVLALQVASGAWLQMNDEAPPGGPRHERIVYIHGPKTHVVRAVALINSQLYEPGESPEAEEDLDMLYNGLTFTEMMESITYGASQMAVFDSGSGSSQAEDQKEQKQAD